MALVMLIRNIVKLGDACLVGWKVGQLPYLNQRT